MLSPRECEANGSASLAHRAEIADLESNSATLNTQHLHMPDVQDLYPAWPAHAVHHPMDSSSDEDKFRYLQILTLLIDADDIIMNEEIDHLKRMVLLLELPNGTLGRLIKFVELPELDELRKGLSVFFDRRGHALMMDLILLAWSDEEFHPKERQFILHCAELLGVSLDQLEAMLKMVEAVRDENDREILECAQKMDAAEIDSRFLEFFWHTSLH